MTSALHPVTPERHAKLRWRRYSNYQWAASQNIVPIFAPELAAAATHLPLAFVQVDGRAIAVAVLGLEAGVNLFVGGDGRWIGGYVPAILRMRPFALVPAQDGKRVLCVDEVAGEVGELPESADTEPFFTPEGELAAGVRHVMSFVSQIEDVKVLTAAATASLQQHGLLVPWAVTLETDQGPRPVEGLYRVDEPAVSKLADDAFLDLRRANALPLLYAQLLSTHQINLLGQLARARAAAIRQQKVMPVTANGELDLSFMNGGDTLRFS